uniref:Uncharacterized protein n=1 Tax=Arundo donax TaxID=35708 RepID=A0A0A9A710_ARUDO
MSLTAKVLSRMLLEMADMGVTLRLSSTVYVTMPWTNPFAPPAEAFSFFLPEPPDPGEAFCTTVVICQEQDGQLVLLTSIT